MSSIDCEDLCYDLNEDSLSYNVHLKVNLNDKLENFDFSTYDNISKYSNIDTDSKKFSIMIEKGKSYGSLGKIYALVKLLSEWNESYTKSYVSDFIKNPSISYFIQHRVYAMEIEKKMNLSLENLVQNNPEIKKLESQTESLKKLEEKYESQTEILKKLEENLSKDLEEKYESQTEILKKLEKKLSKDLEEFGTEYESFKTDITTKWEEQKKSYDEAFETNDLSYKSLLEFVGNEELKTKLESVDNFCVKLPKIEEILSSLNEVSSKIEPLKDLMGIFNEHDLWKKKINKQLEVYKEKIKALETQNSSQQQSD